MITSEQIAKAKQRVKYISALNDVRHEHDDCIRIAYEWLDAQLKIRDPLQRARPLKHIIEKWGGRYVSQSDVEVAAELHPAIKGVYPRFNISARLTLPCDSRLDGIGEAKTQDYAMSDDDLIRTYKLIEEPLDLRSKA